VGCSIRIIGAIFAVTAGLMFAASAALQKSEALRVPESSESGLLAALVRRPRWVLATLLGVTGWVIEAAALSLAPIAVVMPLMATGTGVLVVVGVRWLGERFGRRELMAIALVGLGGPATAILAAGTSVRRPLSLAALLVVGAVALICALGARLRRTAVGFGLAAGFLYAATGVYTKEVGDRFAVEHLRAVGSLLGGPIPWLLGVVAILALAFVQAGFQRGNAATVTAAMAGPDTLGPILAGFLLYREAYPHGIAGALFPIAAVAVVFGIALAARPSERDTPGPMGSDRREAG
jgi:drug/metabolite transporter (DMT)-like permease